MSSGRSNQASPRTDKRRRGDRWDKCEKHSPRVGKNQCELSPRSVRSWRCGEATSGECPHHLSFKPTTPYPQRNRSGKTQEDVVTCFNSSLACGELT